MTLLLKQNIHVCTIYVGLKNCIIFFIGTTKPAFILKTIVLVLNENILYFFTKNVNCDHCIDLTMSHTCMPNKLVRYVNVYNTDLAHVIHCPLNPIFLRRAIV